MYYLRTKAAAAAIQFTVNKSTLKSEVAKASEAAANGKGDANGAKDGDKEMAGVEQNMAAMMCSIQNKDDCLMCGS